MRILRLTFALLALTNLVMTGCKPSEKAEAENKSNKEDLDKLQGSYRIASREGAEAEGEEEDAERAKGVGLEIKIEKDILIYSWNGEVESRRKMTLNSNTKPKQVDLVYVDENGKPITTTNVTKTKGKRKEKKVNLKEVAIYEIDGNKLKLCISWDEKNRPTDFTAPPRSSRYTITFEKVGGAKDEKKEEKKPEEKKEEKKPEEKKPEVKKEEKKPEEKKEEKK